MDIITVNEMIEDYFKKVRDIAQGYLDTKYPEAPDPDMFMSKIATILDEYWNLTWNDEKIN